MLKHCESANTDGKVCYLRQPPETTQWFALFGTMVKQRSLTTCPHCGKGMQQRNMKEHLDRICPAIWGKNGKEKPVV